MWHSRPRLCELSGTAGGGCATVWRPEDGIPQYYAGQSRVGRLRLFAVGGRRGLRPDRPSRVRQFRRQRLRLCQFARFSRADRLGSRVGLHPQSECELDPLDLALADGRLPALRFARWRTPSDQRDAARRHGDAAVPRPATHDRPPVAERLRGSPVRRASPAGGVGGLGNGTQGRPQWNLLHADAVGLSRLRAWAVLACPIRIADRSVCPGTDGQADARDAPLRAAIVGLLAAGPVGGHGRLRRNALPLQWGGFLQQHKLLEGRLRAALVVPASLARKNSLCFAWRAAIAW